MMNIQSCACFFWGVRVCARQSLHYSANGFTAPYVST